MLSIVHNHVVSLHISKYIIYYRDLILLDLVMQKHCSFYHGCRVLGTAQPFAVSRMCDETSPEVEA